MSLLREYRQPGVRTVTNLYTVAFAPLLVLPGSAAKLLDIPAGEVVDWSGESRKMTWRNGQVDWYFVSHQTARKLWQGWMYAGYLADYAEEFSAGVVSIPSSTANPIDAAQNSVWERVNQVNLCGELCAAYILGYDLDTVLANWKRSRGVSKVVYDLVFRNGRASGTSPADLTALFAAFNVLDTTRLDDELRDPYTGRVWLTPQAVARLLRKSIQAIVSVKIEPVKGRLEPSGTLHWVVPVECKPDGAGHGRILVYNPFPNKFERYDWDVFRSSAGVPSGVVVRL
jgi:hypothetical protein